MTALRMNARKLEIDLFAIKSKNGQAALCHAALKVKKSRENARKAMPNKKSELIHSPSQEKRRASGGVDNARAVCNPATFSIYGLRSEGFASRYFSRFALLKLNYISVYRNRIVFIFLFR